ncbi:hypothetical protein Peur_044979 [Populus x canadensis]
MIAKKSSHACKKTKNKRKLVMLAKTCSFPGWQQQIWKKKYTQPNMPLNIFSPNKFLAQSTSTSHHYSPISHSRSVHYPIRTPQLPQAPAHATTASAPTSQPLSATTRKTKVSNSTTNFRPRQLQLSTPTSLGSQTSQIRRWINVMLQSQEALIEVNHGSSTWDCKSIFLYL